MVSPVQRRTVVAWAQTAYAMSQRRACRALGTSRSTVRYQSVRPPREALRRRIRELARVRVSFGYKQIHVLLRREGWPVNHKLVYRLYREEGLVLRRKRPKRRRAAVQRERPEVATEVNQRWAMDFMHDTLSGGRSIRVLAVVDVFSRECIALRAAARFRGEDVAQVLGEARDERGRLPPVISVDNGTEFTSRSLDHWAYWNQVQLDFSRPGKPTDNAHVEAFNSVLRRECLSQHWFLDLPEAQKVLDRWRKDYNNVRPHGSLARLTPAHFGAGGHFTPGPERLAD
jgi:putative transposase